ncbi:MAG: TetR/AcrR family transcriptional regulator [Halieaceae bacterium]
MTAKNDTNSTPASPFNRSAQHDAKRTAILSQAAMLFNSKGSRATTLRDIAESLGLTKTSLYYYVKTKEELIYQCYMAALESHHAHLDRIEQLHSDPLDRASAFFLQHFENWADAREGKGVHIAALLEIASLKGSHRDDVETQYITMFKRLRQYLRDGIEQGKLRQCDATSATRAILGSVEWIFYWLHNIPTDQVQSIGEQALDVLARGLYAGKGNFEPASIKLKPASANQVQGFDREEQNRLKQEAFYKTGTWFFNKKGFNGASLDEIAEHLKVSKGAFYYHIKNKEDLLFNCYKNSLDIVQNLQEQAAETDVTGLQKVELSCRQIFYAQNSEQGPLIRYNTITALPPPLRRKVLQRTNANNSMFESFIKAGIEDGSVREVNTVIAQNLIAGSINAAMDISLWRRVDNIEDAATDYFDVFFNGLLPRP